MNLFDKYFLYGKPDEMLQDQFYSESKIDNNDKLVSIHKSFDYIADKAAKTPLDTNKNKLIKILDIVNKIFDFNEKKPSQDKDQKY